VSRANEEIVFGIAENKKQQQQKKRLRLPKRAVMAEIAVDVEIASSETTGR
jgi:hypothetical protein